MFIQFFLVFLNSLGEHFLVDTRNLSRTGGKYKDQHNGNHLRVSRETDCRISAENKLLKLKLKHFFLKSLSAWLIALFAEESS